jgi:hypothetical protein
MQILGCLNGGFGEVESWKVEVRHNELRRTELQAVIAAATRGVIDRIVIPPGDGLLRVVGKSGEMLTAAGARSDSAAVGNVGCGGGI